MPRRSPSQLISSGGAGPRLERRAQAVRGNLERIRRARKARVEAVFGRAAARNPGRRGNGAAYLQHSRRRLCQTAALSRADGFECIGRRGREIVLRFESDDRADHGVGRGCLHSAGRACSASLARTSQAIVDLERRHSRAVHGQGNVHASRMDIRFRHLGHDAKIEPALASVSEIRREGRAYGVGFVRAFFSNIDFQPRRSIVAHAEVGHVSNPAAFLTRMDLALPSSSPRPVHAVLEWASGLSRLTSAKALRNLR